MKYNLATIILLCSLLTFGQNDEKGIGVIYLKGSLPTIDKPYRDTMYIFKDVYQKEVVSKFIFNNKDRFDLKVLTNEKLSANAFFEFDYEAFGLPITKIDTINKIIEVIYGFSLNVPLKGCVSLKDKRNGYYLWKEFLSKHYLFFTSDKSIRFYRSPNGAVIDVKIAKNKDNKFDYILKPLKIHDGWMLVKLVSPSDYCQERKEKMEIECWINYLSKTGRPLVWYYTRGC